MTGWHIYEIDMSNGYSFQKKYFFAVMVFTDVFNCFKPLLWTKSQKNSEQNIKKLVKHSKITSNNSKFENCQKGTFFQEFAFLEGFWPFFGV